jgi:hypothetical protein
MTTAPYPPERRPTFLLWAALLVAAATVAGSLALSLVEGKKACPLCFYQRTFAMSALAVLALGLVTPALRRERLSLLALPLALGGLGVAAFHVSLEARGHLECPPGLLGLSTAPKDSLAMFLALTVILFVDLLLDLKAGAVGLPAALLALAVSGGLVWASCNSNPPPPKPPDKPYDAPPDVCRPPYTG